MPETTATPPVAFTDETLPLAIAESAMPVLVDVYADWCGPCRLMAPVIDQLARDFAGRVVVGKLDSDRNPTATMSLGVRGIPTLVVFDGGREVGRAVGVVSREDLSAALDQLLADRRAA
jgi:thioredoxin